MARRIVGHWTPAPLTPGMLLGLALAVDLQAIIRGLDYAVGQDAKSARVGAIEAAMPLPVWGGIFFAGGLLLLSGLLLRRQTLAWMGHSTIGIAYAALAVGLLSESAGSPWLDGIRTGTGLVVAAIIHTTLGWLAVPGWTLALRRDAGRWRIKRVTRAADT